jgi:hypothetical protein
MSGLLARGLKYPRGVGEGGRAPVDPSELSLEVGADILRAEEILANEEFENGIDQSIPTRGVCDVHRY